MKHMKLILILRAKFIALIFIAVIFPWCCLFAVSRGETLNDILNDTLPLPSEKGYTWGHAQQNKNDPVLYVDANLLNWYGLNITKEQVNCALLFMAPRYSYISVSRGANTIEIGRFEVPEQSPYYARVRGKPLQPEKEGIVNRDFNFDFSTYKNPRSKFMDDRDLSMLRGVKMAAAFAKKVMKIDFPPLYAVLSTKDQADMNVDRDNSHCLVMKKKESSYGSISKDDVIVAQYRWPPILAQNVLFSTQSVFLLVPDFTYFATFANHHDHGLPHQDVWFEAVEKAAEKRVASLIEDFDNKRRDAVWRGTTGGRDWGYLRKALRKCHSAGWVDSVGGHLMRGDMCLKHQAIVSLPGNGVWTWGCKFALLCASVPLLMSPETVGGETWETRLALGMLPGHHYLSLSSNASTICSEVRNHISWITSNPKDAVALALRGRQVMLQKLDKHSVVRDFTNILLQYANMYLHKPSKGK